MSRFRASLRRDREKSQSFQQGVLVPLFAMGLVQMIFANSIEKDEKDMQFLNSTRFECADFTSWLTMLQDKFVKFFYGDPQAHHDRLAVEKDIYGDWDRATHFPLYQYYRSFWV